MTTVRASLFRRAIALLAPAYLIAAPLYCDAPFLPALMVEPIRIESASECSRLIAAINKEMADRHDVPLFLRAYAGLSVSGEPVQSFALVPAPSFQTLMVNLALFEEDEAFDDARQQYSAMDTDLPKSFLKAVRFDGTHTPGTLLNSLVTASSEKALLEHVERWLASLPANEADTPLVNVFRRIAGDRSFTHLVSINMDSLESLGTLLDQIAVDGWTPAFENENGERCAVQRQAIYQEVD